MGSIDESHGREHGSATRFRRAQARRAHARAQSRRTRPAAKPAAAPLEPVLYRFCKPGWAVLVEQQPSQQGTRFVCPFCPQSHRVSGPVRGFRKSAARAVDQAAPGGRISEVTSSCEADQ